MNAKLIARLAYETARHFLLNPGEKGSDGHPALRLKNLLPSEVGHLLELWSTDGGDDGLGTIQVVIACDADVDCDPRYFAAPGRSITWYRNHNESGLLYIQTKVESDEQGLESMFTVLDRNYLDRSLETATFSPQRRIVELGWEAVFGAGSHPPQHFSDRLEDVRSALRNSGSAISIRPYTAFVVRAAQEIRNLTDGAVDEATLVRGIGRALPALQLFPDEAWAEDGDTARRVALNFRLADLMNPSGVDQDPDTLVEMISRTLFRDGAESLTVDQLVQWRELCTAFVQEPSDTTRDVIPFSIYRQIFASAAVTGVPLGDRVSQELNVAVPERVSEFEALAVQEGLNRRDSEAARSLVEAVTEDSVSSETQPLFECLPTATQKLLRRLAYPRDRGFDDIFARIVEIVRSAPSGEAAQCELRCGRLNENEKASLGLFAFLYGPSLAELVETSALESSGLTFRADQELLQAVPPPKLRSPAVETIEPSDDGEGSASEGPLQWPGVPLELRLLNADGGVLDENANLRWLPEDIEWLAFGWLMMTADDAPKNGESMEFSGDIADCVRQAAQRSASLTDIFHTVQSGPGPGTEPDLDELRHRRRDLFVEVARSGLSTMALSAYVDSWGERLHRLREACIPNGVLDVRLQTVAGLDVLHSTSRQHALILMSHPLRLRWLAAHLRELIKVTLSALAGQLHLNSINESYYLEKLERLSAHGQPALLANGARTLLVPVSEHGFSEVYAAIKREGQVTTLWKSELDETSLRDISQQVLEYLRAHPHKSDGLSLLFVLPSGGLVPGRVVQSVRKGEWKDLPVSCHVIAPRSTWGALIENFQSLETESRMAAGARLNPPLQLELIDWQSEVMAGDQLRHSSFDMAIVPNFFGDKVDVNEHAEPPCTEAGRFDPLFDRPTHTDYSADPGSVSIVLTPEAPDPVLDDWSTVNVRLLRSEAIIPSSPESTDYVKLRIRFEEAAALFASLHSCCQWVVTLDRYVGRNQIESLPQRPDVLTVREGVGQNGLSTLVVSSNAGRTFVVQRLSRKLERLSTSMAGSEPLSLAERIYDEIREVAPGLILRSLGISRVTEEVLGLMVAKRIADRELPPPTGATSIWISLDEHSDWFGGDRGIRADLCRIDLFRQDNTELSPGALEIHVVAVEGKLRQQYDAHGVLQASRSAALIAKGLVPRTGVSEEHVADAHFWRRSILNAMRSVSEKATFRRVHGGADVAGARLTEQDASDIRSGAFQVVSHRALYSICLYGQQGALSKEEVDGVLVFRSSAQHVRDLVKPPADHASIEGELPEHDHGSGPPARGSERSLTGGSSHPPSPGQVGPPPQPAGTSAASARGRMGEAKMRHAYQTVLDTLEEFRVSVHSAADGRPPFVEGPAFVQYRVLPARGVDPKRVSSCEDALRLALKLEEGKRLRFSIGGGTVNIDVPKLDSDRYFVYAKDLWATWSPPDLDRLAVPIGENQVGEIVDINFSSPNSPHLLIGGATGSGKSEALNTILRGLTHYYSPEILKLVLVDPKQTELVGFEGSPHLLRQIGYFDEDAINCLETAVNEMQSRYELFRAKGARDLPEYNRRFPEERLPWQVVVLDEYADLVSEADTRKQVEAAVKRLSQKARACGIHVIVATQKPSAENISTTVRSNLPAQLALKCRGVAESRVVMDEPGAETLNGKGDAFLKVGDRSERVQCALVTG